MTAMQLIDMAIAYKGITRSKVAANLGWSYNHLKYRMQTGKFTLEEWEMIAKAIGSTRAEMHFYFEDGKVI